MLANYILNLIYFRDEMKRGRWGFPMASFRSFDFEILLLGLVAVTSHELLHTSSGIDDALLASIEWMRERADFYLDDVVINAIDLTRLVAGHRGDASPLMFAIDKQDWVVDGMDSGFHAL